MGSSIRRWCFTLNYETEEEAANVVRRIESLNLVYAIVGDEVAPSTGQRHLQGFIHLKTGRRLQGLKTVLGNDRIHLEPTRGSDEQNRDYCSKERVLLEHGVPTRPGVKRPRLAQRFAEEPDELRLEDPGGYRRCVVHGASVEWTRWAAENPFPFPYHNWQLEVLSAIGEPADDRTILWICGRDGGDGKSVFAKYLGLKPDWFYTCGGTRKDVLYQYIEDPKRNLILDVPRCNLEYLNYALLECVKNRAFSSDKYEPLSYLGFDHVHVLVFANVLPDYLKISRDRIKLWNI
ncbi:ORF1 [Coconut foliar decay alphasatellite]|uniref:Replication initiator protein n=2 Tax=Coconut foliar decay alphasatellite 1 TaxID=2161874 RepID=A0A2R4N9A3_9VIRU|nr:ORF1 [Coconut foliar decay alphasatellite]AAA42894.1 ORF1 [Coconut foliar decay virus]AVX29414.1 replication initiator protein [Coconut foliar decay alphasatellite 1]AVX29416.1 replication initiator protein [Coconut foliar decay alphasatellite 1]prf//2119408A replication-related gene [Coconut foliar decay virus]